MSKKQSITKKSKPEKAEIELSRDEADELQMIVDRLAVQNPEGESFERYLHSLRNALGQRPHMAAALLEKLSKNAGPTGFRTFLTLEGVVENSPYKRRLKQASYRFSQRGFTTEDKETAPKKVVLIQGEVRNPVSHFFHVQGTLWLISAMIPETGSSPYSLITAFLEDDFETFNVKITETTQKFYREYLQKISPHTLAQRALEIPTRHAARLFFEMLDLFTAKAPGPEVEQGRAIFKRYYEPDIKPYVYDLMAEVVEPERHFSEIDLANLFEGLDVTWLRFPKDDLASVHEKLIGIDSPLLVVPPEVQIERKRALIRSTADSLCVGKMRRLFQRFFEEQAMAFKLSGLEEKAQWAWILARHFASDSTAGENPAAFEIVIHSLEHYWPGEVEEQAPQTERHREERRTESGIILP